MKKIMLFVLLCAAVVIPAEICFTIDNGKIDRIVAAMEGLYPIPLINTGTEENPVWEPQYTPNQWAKECIRRWIVRQDRRWRQKQYQDTVSFYDDNELVE